MVSCLDWSRYRPVRPEISAEQPVHSGPGTAAGVRRTKGMRRGSPTQRQGRNHLSQLPPYRRGGRPPPRLTQDGVPLGQGGQAALPEDPGRPSSVPRSRDSATWPRGFARKRPPKLLSPFIEEADRPGSGEAGADGRVGSSMSVSTAHNASSFTPIPPTPPGVIDGSGFAAAPRPDGPSVITRSSSGDRATWARSSGRPGSRPRW